MKRIYLLAGLGLFTACLAGWVALANAQSIPGAVPPVEPAAVESPAQPVPPGPGRGEGPPVGSPRSATGLVVPPPPSLGDPAQPGVPESGMPSRLPGTKPTPREASSDLTVVSPRGTLPAGDGMPPVGSVAGKPAPDDKPDPALEQLAGRQEPGVSLEWVGTPVAKVGQAGDYSLVIRNQSNAPLQQVSVKVRIPAALSVQASAPKAQVDGGMLTWDLGVLPGKQERIIQMKLQAVAKGDSMPQAWVTCTGSAVMRVSVREPKLALKCSVPDKVMVGEAAAFTLTVSNPGDGSADQVKIHAMLSEGLEHARGNKIDFDIGNIAPGESRNVTLLCATRTGGAQKCEAVAEAEGGLTARDAVALNVIMPRLDLHLSGPGLRYLERKAVYTLKVTNPGDAPASNVTVADTVPAGFKVLAASHGGRHDFQTRTVSWFLGEIGPGQTREVKLEVQAANVGDLVHKATAVGARGLRAESQLMTRVEGLSALLVELVDTDDPVEAGGDTAYEVRITNTGSKAETDIRLVAVVPDRMEFKSAINAGVPARFRVEGKTIVFEPVERLAPRADAIFRINVKALTAGTSLFKIQVTSANLTDPVVKMESTRIYSDAPETGGSPSASPAPAGTPGAPGQSGPATPPAVVPPAALPGGIGQVPVPAPVSAPEPVTPPATGTPRSGDS